MTNPLKSQSVINVGVGVGKYFLGVCLHEKACVFQVESNGQENSTLRDKRRIQSGSASVRTVLYRTTLSAIQCNPLIQLFYKRMADQGKHKKVVITTCLRQLLVILNTMVKYQKPWCRE